MTVSCLAKPPYMFDKLSYCLRISPRPGLHPFLDEATADYQHPEPQFFFENEDTQQGVPEYMEHSDNHFYAWDHAPDFATSLNPKDNEATIGSVSTDWRSQTPATSASTGISIDFPTIPRGIVPPATDDIRQYMPPNALQVSIWMISACVISDLLSR